MKNGEMHAPKSVVLFRCVELKAPSSQYNVRAMITVDVAINTW